PAPPTLPPFPYTTLFRSVMIRKLDAGRHGEGAAVKRMHAVGVDKSRQVRRTSNPADGDNVVRRDLEFDKRLLKGRQHTEIAATGDRKSTRLNSSHGSISY